MLIGADAMACERSGSGCYNRLRDHGQPGPLVEAISAIDVALWDIRGNIPGADPCLLGGPLRTEVAAYATGLYRRRDGDPEPYLARRPPATSSEGSAR